MYIYSTILSSHILDCGPVERKEWVPAPGLHIIVPENE